MTQQKQDAITKYNSMLQRVISRSNLLSRGCETEQGRNELESLFESLIERAAETFPVEEKAFKGYGLSLVQKAMETAYQKDTAKVDMTRDARILMYLPLVNQVYSIMKPAIGSAPFVGDMIQHGTIGLIEEVDACGDANSWQRSLPCVVLNIGAHMFNAARDYGYSRLREGVVVRNYVDIGPKSCGNNAKGGLETNVLELLALQIVQRI